MARRAKLLNQLAHLQLLQSCAVSCRRGRALVGIIADALRKSEVPTPPTAAAVAATVYSASTKQGLVSPLSNYSRSLTRSLGSPQTDHGRSEGAKGRRRLLGCSAVTIFHAIFINSHPKPTPKTKTNANKSRLVPRLVRNSSSVSAIYSQVICSDTYLLRR